MKFKKLCVIMALVLVAIFFVSVSVSALSPVRCTGGFAGETKYKHNYTNTSGSAAYHWVYEESHTVDRVYSGHVYEVLGHTKTNCGNPSLSYNLSPGCIGTIVGYG